MTTSETTTNVQPKTQPTRGKFLSGYLIFMMVVNLFIGIYYIANSSTRTIPRLSPELITLSGIASLANFVFAMALWNWKKWGLYGFMVSAAFAFMVNLANFGLTTALTGLAGLAFLIFLLRKIWGEME